MLKWLKFLFNRKIRVTEVWFKGSPTPDILMYGNTVINKGEKMTKRQFERRLKSGDL